MDSSNKIESILNLDKLILELKNLGIEKGMDILVENKSGPFLDIIGGTEILLEALINCIGSEGTLLMPNFNLSNQDPSYNKNYVSSLYDEIKTSLPEAKASTFETDNYLLQRLRNKTSTFYSRHPTFGFVALGKRAELLIYGQKLDLPFSSTSPLSRLYELKGKHLIIGLDFCKSIGYYYGQYRSGKYSLVLNGCQDQGRWRKFFDLYRDHYKMSRLAEVLKKSECYKERKIGEQVFSLYDYREEIDLIASVYSFLK